MFSIKLQVRQKSDNLNYFCENYRKKFVFLFVNSETLPKRSWLRGGVYFVDSLSKTNNGKLLRREITKIASKMFREAKQNNDPEIESYLSDLPIEFRQLI